VVRDPELMTSGDSGLKGFECLILEFDNLSAVQTDQVVVMTSLESGFIPGLSVNKFSLGCQAEASEELQGTIDGDIADFRISFSDLCINLCKVLVSGGIEKDGEDLFPLFGRLQSFSRNVCLKETIFQ